MYLKATVKYEKEEIAEAIKQGVTHLVIQLTEGDEKYYEKLPLVAKVLREKKVKISQILLPTSLHYGIEVLNTGEGFKRLITYSVLAQKLAQLQEEKVTIVVKQRLKVEYLQEWGIAEEIESQLKYLSVYCPQVHLEIKGGEEAEKYVRHLRKKYKTERVHLGLDLSRWDTKAEECTESYPDYIKGKEELLGGIYLSKKGYEGEAGLELLTGILLIADHCGLGDHVAPYGKYVELEKEVKKIEALWLK